MKILGSLVAVVVLGCALASDKAAAALRVLRDQLEGRLVRVAGEGEVALALSMEQYAERKERLVRMKTLRATFSDRMDQLIADKDDQRARLYGEKVVYLDSKIPDAEAALREMHALYQRQKREIRFLNDETAAFAATGMLSESLALTSAHERRAETIQDLTQQVREKAKRAQSLMEVQQWEETLGKR